MRRDRLPRMLFLETYRLGPHSKGDDDRDPAEIERHRENDPLARAALDLDAGYRAEIERQVADDVAEIVAELVG